MRVKLAGFNIDTGIMEQLNPRGRRHLTPETLSAAYARISRSPLSIDQLRKKACLDVEKARQSNQKIIFEMGHHSVAEHAVFNFDIMGVSRLALEEIEKFRLVSYTEKSQRYVTLEGDFVIPAEIKDAALKKVFREAIQSQNRFYFKSFAVLNKMLAGAKPGTGPRASRPEARGGLGQGRRPLYPFPGHQRPGRHDHQCPQPGTPVPPLPAQPQDGSAATRRKIVRPGPAHRPIDHSFPRAVGVRTGSICLPGQVLPAPCPKNGGTGAAGSPRLFPARKTATT